MVDALDGVATPFFQAEVKTVVPTESTLYGFSDESSTDLNLNVSDSSPLDFIFSPYAFGLSGVFVWSALIITCFQVHFEPC